MSKRVEVEACLVETGRFRTRVPGRDDDEIERALKSAKKACRKNNNL